MTESRGIPTIRARIPAPPPPESALERLLATDGCLEPPRFVSDAIFVARGSDPFRRVAAEVPESLDDALRWFARADVRLVQAEAARAIEVSGTKAFSAYAYGYTVFWDQVGKSIPSWSSWERQLESDLGIPAGSCRIKLSLSPPGSGFPAHFDRYDTFQLQLLGTKVWHIAENDHVSFPLHGHLLGEAEHPDLMRYHAAAMPVRIATAPSNSRRATRSTCQGGVGTAPVPVNPPCRSRFAWRRQLGCGSCPRSSRAKSLLMSIGAARRTGRRARRGSARLVATSYGICFPAPQRPLRLAHSRRTASSAAVRSAHQSANSRSDRSHRVPRGAPWTSRLCTGTSPSSAIRISWS